MFVLTGYSLTSLVLYYESSDKSFNNFWHAFFYTTLVHLQAESLGDYKIFGANKTGKAQDDQGYVAYVTEAQDDQGYVAYVTEALQT